MDSMKIIKIMVICGLSVDSPWTEKLNLGVSTAKKNSMESMEHPWSPRIHVDSTRITQGSDKSSNNPVIFDNMMQFEEAFCYHSDQVSLILNI